MLFNLMGAARLKLGHGDEAQTLFRKSVTLDPTYAQAFNNLGSALLKDGKADDAAAQFHAALALDPGSVQTLSNFCAARIAGGRYEEAAELGQKAVELEPESPSANNNLGIAFKETGRFEEAITCLKTALRTQPEFVDAHNNLGSVYLELCQFQDAGAALETARELDPSHIDTTINLAKLFKETGRFDAAFQAYSKVLELDPGSAEAEFGLASLLLRKKDFAAGWKRMETRWMLKDKRPAFSGTEKPFWTGDHVGKLFIWKEQGVGDEVMFASCLEDLQHHCETLTVGASKRLVSLFRRSFPESIDFIPSDQINDFSDFDQHAPALTALGYMRQTDDQFHNACRPYLKPDAVHLAETRKQIAFVAGGRRVVGVSWKTNNSASAKKRNIPLDELLQAIPDDCFPVNLQYGDVLSDIETARNKTQRDVFCHEQIDILSDLDGFASLVSACDVVVTIDNSTAHFAGALGSSCQLLIPTGADWRWGLNGETQSYWYGSVNLHWQSQPGEWSEPLASLHQALKQEKTKSETR